MDSQKVESYFVGAAKNFPADKLEEIKQKLAELDDEKFAKVEATQFKNPMVAFWLDFVIGNVGAEYFYLGKTGLAVAKLLTCGGVGFWSLFNLFTICGTTKKMNYDTLKAIIG